MILAAIQSIPLNLRIEKFRDNSYMHGVGYVYVADARRLMAVSFLSTRSFMCWEYSGVPQKSWMVARLR